MKNLFRKAGLFFAFLCPSVLFSEAFVSTEMHGGKVNAFFSLESFSDDTAAFYSAGEDGFLIKWGNDNLGEHYQVTDLSVKSVVKNPSTGDLAVYETDGSSVFRVTVVDSVSYARRYTKRLENPVTALSFSEQGTYLIIATSSVNSCMILDSRNGNLVKKVEGVSGTVTLAKTGATEKSAVFYATTSASAAVYFYDLTKFKVIKKFPAEYMLEQPVLFGSGKYANRFLAGVRTEQVESGGTKYDYWGKVDKKNYKTVTTLFIIDAASGTLLSRYSEKDPFIFSNPLDGEKEGLYMLVPGERTSSIKHIPSAQLENQLIKIKQFTEKKQTANVTKTVENPPEPELIKTFASPKGKETITSASKTSSLVMLGTSSGNIIVMSDTGGDVKNITENMYTKITDVAEGNGGVYLLTEKAFYYSSYGLDSIEKLFDNTSSFTDVLVLNDTVLLWKKGTAEPVEKRSLSKKNATSSVLFTPSSALQELHLYDSAVLAVEGDTDVFSVNLSTGKKSRVYSGTAIQDAVFVDSRTVYIAKTNTGNKNDSIVAVDIKTGEAISLKLKANVCYSLSSGKTGDKNLVFAIAVKTEKEKSISELISIDTVKKTQASLLRLTDEDSKAFTSLSYPFVYTNLGRNQMYACNAENGRNILYRRTSSMPLKAVRTGEKIVVLNGNGSVSWYDIKSQSSCGDWFVTVKGEWFEL